MGINQDFKDLLRYLNTGNVKYLIVGAYATIYYTEPRYTKDIDIWIATDPENAKQTYEALKKFGAPVEQISPKDLENRDLVYQIGIEPNRIDVLMDIEGVDFQKAWKDKESTSYGGEPIYILSLENLIQAKKASNRPQDKIDLENLLKSQKQQKS